MMRRLFLLGVLAGGAALAVRVILRAVTESAGAEPAPDAKTYVLERSSVVAAPLGEVFDFFSDPQNLALITPGSMGFEILDVQHMPMRPGTTIDYRLRPLGVPQHWRTEIVEYEPGRRFVDRQARGPYRYWRHEHAFEAVEGGTLMRDRIEYQLPLGPLGRIAHAALVARQLQAIFDYREQVMARHFGAPATAG